MGDGDTPHFLYFGDIQWVFSLPNLEEHLSKAGQHHYGLPNITQAAKAGLGSSIQQQIRT